jgi:hypothetical protein
MGISVIRQKRDMPRAAAAIAAVIVATSLAGCASRVPASALDPRLSYVGFSVDRPPNDNWYLNTDEQSRARLFYRRELHNPSNTFFFQASMIGLEREPQSESDFASLIREYNTSVSDPSRHEIVSYALEPTSAPGPSCIRYSTLTLDKRVPGLPGRVLKMKIEGVACRHPSRPDAVLDAFYSERGSATQIPQYLRDEGDKLLNSLTIDSVP